MNLDDLFATLDQLIAAAPAAPPVAPRSPQIAPPIAFGTDMPNRYRDAWQRPSDAKWGGHFARAKSVAASGGIIALIGKRGTGKTRLAAEVLRDKAPERGRYTTAMGLFLRIRASFSKTSPESEAQIIEELARCPLLILDELQERGNTAWEDRLLTHLLDRRYGAMKPTILIANLEPSGLTNTLGDSIVSRLNETGGVLHLDGPSHRTNA